MFIYINGILNDDMIFIYIVIWIVLYLFIDLYFFLFIEREWLDKVGVRNDVNKGIIKVLLDFYSFIYFF